MLSAPGLDSPVVIRRDDNGVPHVEAASEADAWYGLGFCHGQDRSFQLEVQLRASRGTLAALVGPAALPIDRLARRIGFRRSAEAQLGALAPDVGEMVSAYARGVSAGATVGCPRAPHELALLRSRPTPHRPADVLAFGKLLAFLMPTNWDVELARLRVLREDGLAALLALDPAYPEWLPVTDPPVLPAGPAAARLADDVAVLQETLGSGGGSNNWAISPSRTRSGRALVACDPHLEPLLPCQFYLAHLVCPEWQAAGGTIVGAPGFFVGHNGFVAWGVTVGFLDNTDLVVEELGPEGRSVWRGDTLVPCQVRPERIRVRGRRTPVEETVLVGPDGPIVGPALDGEVGALALRATWLEPRPVGGILRLHRARSADDVHALLAEWPAVSQNVVYASVDGDIGWQLCGDVPRRRGSGALPWPGRHPAAGWDGVDVRYEDLPRSRNPSCGFVATANNKPVVDGRGPPLGCDWLGGYRIARIVEALAEREDWSPEATAALQLDVASVPWREIRETVLDAPARDRDAALAQGLLREWDGQVGPSSVGATVFEVLSAELCRRLVTRKAPATAAWALGAGFGPLRPRNLLGVRRASWLSRLLREQPAGWLDRPWPDEVVEALVATTRELLRRFGEPGASWAWGRVRPLVLRHPLGVMRPLSSLFDIGPFPWGGDSNTVSQAGATALDPTGPTGNVASMRMVVEVGDWENARFVLLGGQSGNPVSRHYADLVPLWRRGEGVPIPWSPAAVRRAAFATLRLQPC